MNAACAILLLIVKEAEAEAEAVAGAAQCSEAGKERSSFSNPQHHYK